MTEAEKITMAYIIKNGRVGADWKFYSANFHWDGSEYKKTIKALTQNDIDYKKSKVWDDVKSSFLGTFTEETEKHSTLHTKIVLSDGSEHVLSCRMDDNGFCGVVNEMLTLGSPEAVISFRYNQFFN